MSHKTATRAGKPFISLPNDVDFRAVLEARTERRSEAECWPWLGSVAVSRGFRSPRVKVHQREYSAKRLAYNVFKGEIPKGKLVRQICRNELCVNPFHLEAVWEFEKTAKSDSVTAPQVDSQFSTGYCINGHDLSKVGYHRKGRVGWRCAKCSCDCSARHRQRKRDSQRVEKASGE